MANVSALVALVCTLIAVVTCGPNSPSLVATGPDYSTVEAVAQTHSGFSLHYLTSPDGNSDNDLVTSYSYNLDNEGYTMYYKATDMSLDEAVQTSDSGTISLYNSGIINRQVEVDGVTYLVFGGGSDSSASSVYSKAGKFVVHTGSDGAAPMKPEDADGTALTTRSISYNYSGIFGPQVAGGKIGSGGNIVAFGAPVSLYQAHFVFLSANNLYYFYTADFGRKLPSTPSGIAFVDLNGDGVDEVLVGFIFGPKWTSVDPAHTTDPDNSKNTAASPLDGTAAIGERTVLSSYDSNSMESDFDVTSSSDDRALATGSVDIYDGSLIYTSVTNYNAMNSSSSAYSCTYFGENAHARMGEVIVAAGDVNGDGYDDAIISAPGTSIGSYQGAGAIYILFGAEVLTQTRMVQVHAPSDAYAAYSQYGSSLAVLQQAKAGVSALVFAAGAPGSNENSGLVRVMTVSGGAVDLVAHEPITPNTADGTPMQYGRSVCGGSSPNDLYVASLILDIDHADSAGSRDAPNVWKHKLNGAMASVEITGPSGTVTPVEDETVDYVISLAYDGADEDVTVFVNLNAFYTDIKTQHPEKYFDALSETSNDDGVFTGTIDGYSVEMDDSDTSRTLKWIVHPGLNGRDTLTAPMLLSGFETGSVGPVVTVEIFSGNHASYAAAAASGTSITNHYTNSHTATLESFTFVQDAAGEVISFDEVPTSATGGEKFQFFLEVLNSGGATGEFNVVHEIDYNMFLSADDGTQKTEYSVSNIKMFNAEGAQVIEDMDYYLSGPYASTASLIDCNTKQRAVNDTGSLANDVSCTIPRLLPGYKVQLTHAFTISSTVESMDIAASVDTTSTSTASVNILGLPTADLKVLFGSDSLVGGTLVAPVEASGSFTVQNLRSIDAEGVTLYATFSKLITSDYISLELEDDVICDIGSSSDEDTGATLDCDLPNLSPGGAGANVNFTISIPEDYEATIEGNSYLNVTVYTISKEIDFTENTNSAEFSVYSRIAEEAAARKNTVIGTTGGAAVGAGAVAAFSIFGYRRGWFTKKPLPDNFKGMEEMGETGGDAVANEADVFADTAVDDDESFTVGETQL